MTQAAPATRRTVWPEDGLYVRVEGFFPAMRTERDFFDVNTLAARIGCSWQAVFKWFNADRLTAERARQIIALANEEANQRNLADVGREPPSISDLFEFIR